MTLTHKVSIAVTTHNMCLLLGPVTTEKGIFKDAISAKQYRSAAI